MRFSAVNAAAERRGRRANVIKYEQRKEFGGGCPPQIEFSGRCVDDDEADGAHFGE